MRSIGKYCPQLRIDFIQILIPEVSMIRKRRLIVNTALLTGSSQELCYLGGDAVLTPQPLTGGETLRMGGAAMKFVPFCGAEFHW